MYKTMNQRRSNQSGSLNDNSYEMGPKKWLSNIIQKFESHDLAPKWFDNKPSIGFMMVCFNLKLYLFPEK